MNAITATIGADVAPLKKDLQTVEQLSKATSKRVAEESKRTAAANKASSEALRNGARGAAKELVNAASAADVAAIGVSHIGENLKLGLVGGIAIGALGAIIGKVDEAVERARVLRDTLATAFRPKGGAGSYSVGDIQGQIAKTMEVGAMLKERQNSPVLSAMKDKLANGWNAITSKIGFTDRAVDEGDDARREKLGKEAASNVERLTEKTKMLAEIELVRVKYGERAAALKAIELERMEKVGAAIALAQNISDTTGMSVSTVGLQKQARDEANQKSGEAERRSMEATRELADQAQEAFALAAANEAALTDRAAALAQEIERISGLQKEMIRRGDELADNDERSKQYAARANQFAAKKLELQTQQKAMERELSNARTDSDNAQAQSAIQTLALTNHALASKQQIALLDKEIADLAERRKKAEEGAKPAIDAQTAALKAQKAQAQNARDMMTPAQKRAEKLQDRRDARHKRHNRSVEETIAADKERAKQMNGGGNDKFFDEARQRKLHPENFKLERPHMNRDWAKPTLDFRVGKEGRGIDDSQLAKDMRILAAAAAQARIA